jgi:signal transduction histidine kinase
MTLVIVLGVQSNRESTLFRQAEQTKYLATDFLLKLRTAESSQRGYLMTGNPDYLRGYRAVGASLPAALTRLEAATAAEPAQKARMARIRSEYEIKRREMVATLNVENAGKSSKALSIINSGIGFEKMGKINNEVQLVIDHYDAMAKTFGSKSNKIYYFNLAALILIVIFGFITFHRIVLFIRLSRSHRSALDQGNANLAILLRSRTAEIARVNEEIQRYGYIVGHDLRGPLINIIGFTAELQRAETALERQLQTLKSTLPKAIAPDFVMAVEQDIPEAIRFIEASTARMDRLITAVLKLSREGQRTIVPEPIDMGVMIADLVTCQAQQIEAHGCVVSIGALPDLISDRMAVELVFGNLIENAVKYLDPARPGRIEILGTVQGDRNIYQVSDNGRGIAANDHERVFELFRRAGEQTTTGEGVGLAYVRNAIYRLDGAITLTSVAGAGTQFTIDLPARPAPPEASAA